MKRTAICLVFLLVMTGMALAQNKKGTIFIGTSFGSAGYTFGKSEASSSLSPSVSINDSASLSLSVYPSIGFYISDGFVLGTYFSFGVYNYTSKNSTIGSTMTSESTSKSISLAVGPFIRYYLGKEGDKGRPYLHAYIQANIYPLYSGEYTPNTGSGYAYKYTGYLPFSGGVQLGYEHYLTPAIGLQYYVGYSLYTYDYKTEYDYPTSTDVVYDSQYTSHGISFGVGLQIHLNREKK